MIEHGSRGSRKPVLWHMFLRAIVVLAAVYPYCIASQLAHAQMLLTPSDQTGSSFEEEALLDSIEDDYASEEAAAIEVPDPFEPVNRVVFGLNRALDEIILKPVVHTYRLVIPEPIRLGARNAVNNTYAPATILNAALQGDRQKVGDTTVRFLLNTTLGVGGLIDVATMAGLPQHYEDFAQTLAVNGVPTGPYVVVPVLGPSSARHLAGRTVDYLTNPLSWLLWDADALVSVSPTMAVLVTQRETNFEAIEAMEQYSPDYYVSAKSAYFQNRQSTINNDYDEIKSGPERN